MEFCQGAIMVAHNADFDMSFILADCKRQGIDCDFTYIDTVALARFLLPNLSRYKLDNVAKALGVSLEHHHRAVDDAECTAHIFEKCQKMLLDRGYDTLDKVNEAGAASTETIRKMPSYHCIILAKNDLGGSISIGWCRSLIWNTFTAGRRSQRASCRSTGRG